MKGKEILLKSLKREATPRAAWLPFVGVHGATLINESADNYLQSADLIVDGLTKAYELYRPDGLPIIFDLQIEAEVLGCDLHWAKDVPPSVTSHPLADCEDEEDIEEALAELPEYTFDKGRFPLIADATRRMKESLGEEVALYGLICGPFTLALHLMGNDIFLNMYDEPEAVKLMLKYCEDIAKKTAQFYIENGCDVVAIVDPMTSQISPDHFNEFCAPFMNEVFNHVRDLGALSSIFVCGDVDRNLEVMCQTTADCISVDEQIDMNKLRVLAEKYNKSFGGNMKLTVVLLMGDETDAKLNAIDCLEAGGDTGFILAPGCDLPFKTPVANLQAVAEMVHDPYQRDIAKKTLEVKALNVKDIELPDYAGTETVYIDVITLDSTACAPCKYMMDAAIEAADTADAEVIVREHKINNEDGIAMMCKLGVANLPTICIDGEIKFISIIPDMPTLVNAVQTAADNK